MTDEPTVEISFTESELDSLRDLVAMVRDHAKGALDVYTWMDAGREVEADARGKQREARLIQTCDRFMARFDPILKQMFEAGEDQ